MLKSQKSLFNNLSISEQKIYKRRLIHGGQNSKGRRKLHRPLIVKKWTHVVLKSDRAKGIYNFLTAKNSILIKQILRAKSKKAGVVIGDFVNMGNHLHLKVKFSSREQFKLFLRSITGLIARKITNAKRGKPFGRFWQGLVFTRVLSSALEDLQISGYFKANRIQREKGLSSRADYLEKLNLWIQMLRKGAIRSYSDLTFSIH